MVDSNEIRIEGFRTLYNADAGGKLKVFLQYVRSNGGLSRYRKIRYYYEHIRQQSVTSDTIERDAQHYSRIVAEAVVNAPEIPGAIVFLDRNRHLFRFALVSASDQNELRTICGQRRIAGYFDTVLGSPVEKQSNICTLLQDLHWKREQTVYVGDSINDQQAADASGVSFIGFGRDNFRSDAQSCVTVDSFGQLQKLLLDEE